MKATIGKLRQVLSMVLAVIMLLSMVPAMNISAAEAEVADLSAEVPAAELAADTSLAEVADGTTADGLEYKVSNDKVTITDYTGSATELAIPSTIEGASVRYIGDSAFYKCTSLESITIPDSITSIGDAAFYGCTFLENIYITDLNAWLDIMFKEYGSNPLCNGGKLYLNGEILEELVIPEGVTYVRDRAFSGCTSLTSVVIPEGVTHIRDWAFDECTSLKSVTIPSSFSYIGEGSFYGCTSLESVMISECDASWISRFAFEECTSLESIIIPEGVVIIDEAAFADCTSLESVTIPTTVEIIEEAAFAGCNSLEKVYINDLKKWLNILFYSGSSNPLCYGGKLYLNGELVEKLEIPEGITTIGKYMFRGCTSLLSVIIPEGMKYIGEFAFAECTSLANITIPYGIINIGNSTFYGCESLSNIIIPEDVTSIGDEMFYGCKSLSSITIPSSVTSIGKSAFESCTSLESITIPEGVTSIGYSAFEGCTSLESITIPESVTSIGGYAFYNCTSLNDVYYGGTEEQWNAIDSYYGCLKNATIHFAGDMPEIPTEAPTEKPTTKPTEKPTQATDPTEKPTTKPTEKPTQATDPTEKPTVKPAEKPTQATDPTEVPTETPTEYLTIYFLNMLDWQDISFLVTANSKSWLLGMNYLESTENGDVYYLKIPAYVESIRFAEDMSDNVSAYITDFSDGVCFYCTDKNTDGYYQVNSYIYGNNDEQDSSTATVVTKPVATVPATDVPETEITFPEEYISDEKTNIAVGGNTDKEVELKVSEVTSDKEIEDIDLILIGEKVNKVFDITLQKDGTEVQPDGKVYVRIPAENPESKVYRMETDGTLTDMNAVYVDGYLVFTTEHFSLYVVAEPTEETDDSIPPAEDEPTTPTEPEVKYLIGDANGDGKINVKDATQIQKAVAGLVTLDEVGNLAADSDQNEKVNVKDATAIQKFVAGIPVDAPIGEERKK